MQGGDDDDALSRFCEDGYIYTFFSDGLQYERFSDGTDSEFIQYSQIKHVKHTATEDKVVLTLGAMNSFIFSCENDFRAAQLADLITYQMRAWHNRSATRTKEERTRLAEECEFRASLFAKLGDVLDRIMFEPGVGYEAFEAVDKCKKRTFGEVDE